MRSVTNGGRIVIVVLIGIFCSLLARAQSPSESEVLEAYLRVFPEVKAIGIVYSQADKEEGIQKLEELAKAKKVKVIKVRVPSLEGFPQALREMKEKVDTFWVLDDPLFSLKEAWSYFVMFTVRNGIKTVVFSEKSLASGGLFFYAENKEVLINKRILEVNGFKVSEKAGSIKYYGTNSEDND